MIGNTAETSAEPTGVPQKPRRVCFWVDPTQDPGKHGGYVPSLVTEDEPGHAPLVGNGVLAQPYLWGADLATARHVCEEQNARTYGLSPREALDIVASSMGAGRAEPPEVAFAVSVDAPGGWLEIATGFESAQRAGEWAASLVVAYEIDEEGTG